jgi:antitoxin component of MazEF toxin-antitoxin module
LVDLDEEARILTKTAKIGKRGNGLWFRVPAVIVKQRNLKPGDEVLLTRIGEGEFKLSRVCSQCGAREKILTLRRILPPDNGPEPNPTATEPRNKPT